ncbi:MAG: DegV family protein [Lachnospiraceae bacterium]|nr:DegV family protein [Lachnospiraceae bacterium]
MYQLITDSSWDMGSERAKKLNIGVVPYYVTFDGNTFLKEEVEQNVRDFYQFMVDNPKVYPHTSLPTVDDFITVFDKYASKGMDIICFTLSSKFSGSFNSANIAGTEIMERYPGVRVRVMDTTMATLMQGLFIQELANYRDSGATFEELWDRAEKIRGTAKIFFTIHGLDYLVHGGRLGKLSAISADILHLRPLILMTNGELYSMGLARGRKHSISKICDKLLEYVRENCDDPSQYSFMVGYGYDIEEGHELCRYIQYRMKEIWPDASPFIDIGQIGVTIGVHIGPYPLGFGVIRKAI